MSRILKTFESTDHLQDLRIKPVSLLTSFWIALLMVLFSNFGLSLKVKVQV